MKSNFLLFAVFISFILAGCEGCNLPFSFGSGTSVEKAQEEIRNINLSELEVCRVLIGPPRTNLAINTSPSISGGPSSASPSNASDAAAWQNQLDSQLFGDSDGGSAGSTPSSASAAPSAGLPGASIYSTPTYQNGEIIRVDILQRDDPRSAFVNVSPSGTDASSASGGYARLTTTRTNRGRSVEEIHDNVRVNLTYQLSRVSGGWRCIAVNAEPSGENTVSPVVGRSSRSSGGRIGW